MSDVVIYRLICPVTNKTMYVGKARDADFRLNRHLLLATRGNKTPKSEWFRDLQKTNLSPILEIIEACSFDNWRERETYWITYHRRLNPGLKNVRSGGSGAPNKPVKIKPTRPTEPVPRGSTQVKRTRIDRFKVKSKMPNAPIAITTFEELATAAGISQTTIYSAIDSYSWRAATLDAIANALDVPSISLLTIDEVESHP